MRTARTGTDRPTARVALALTLAAGLALTACGGGGGDARQEGEVVSFGTSVSLDALAGGDAGELTISSLEVDIGDEVVDATVEPGDQDQLSQQFTDGDLAEGDQVVVEQAEDDTWVFVEVAGG